MSNLIFSSPKVSLSLPTTNISYCYIKYSGNTVATSKVVNSGKITTGLYISGDLSINTLYTFTLTPLDTGDISGVVKTIFVDTTPQFASAKSNVKSTYEATRLQWSGTAYDNYTVSRSINSTNSYTDISTNVKTGYYYDSDLSGNTMYYYYVKPYDSTGNQYQSAINLSTYTNVRSPTDLSYTFLDSSGISLKWITKNSYTTSYYNAAYAVSPTGAVLSISGDIQSGTITGLSKNTTYTCYAQTYLLAGTTITVTTASPYVGGNIAIYNVSMDSITVSWSGTYYDRVAISRRVGTLLPYVDICGADYASPYVDSDISGNTTYYYYVTPKLGLFTGSASSVVSSTTPVAYPTDVSAIFYDASAIKLQFSTPKNTYTSVVYSAIASDPTGGSNTTVTGTSPILISNLSSSTTYTCYIKVSLNSGASEAMSSVLSVTTNYIPSIVVNSLSGNNPIYSSSLKYYCFTDSSNTGLTTGSITFKSIRNNAQLYIFAVGGGGGSNNDGGGGGGGVVQSTFSYSNNSTETLTISVGNGGASSNSGGTNGYNTTISFSLYPQNNITAYGGGYGGKYSQIGANGGSGGGGGRNTMIGGSASYSSSNNLGNKGGDSVGNFAGGGGGASTSGSNGSSSTSKSGNGGDGIKPSLNIISTYFNYYFAGGGGGNCNNGTAGNGGLGGGGGGCCSGGTAGNGDNNGINSATNGIVSSTANASTTAGSGGINTGGGAGGLITTGSSKNTGGSGIVIIAFS